MTSPIDQEFFKLLSMSYRRLLGKPLVASDIPAEEAAVWLYEKAPFGLLAHNTEPDPVFVYGNRKAQELFEYSWNELTALPSKLSAEAPDRDARQAFLEQVQRHGFVAAYRGVRVAKSGRRFWIENAVVWQLHDETGRYCGQAALIPGSSTA
ncbi:MEKHLA domain-containing protein [Paraburkholderia sediminicola]|uniref:MEKHLA domain-containing protein n=1 Tax=Paraburkholderia sediminicola TaxID=458836 RepID=UPI0038B7B87A